MLEINNLEYRIENRTLYKTEKIQFKEGQLSVIAGDSGSGKTTLLSIIGLIERGSWEYQLNNHIIDVNNDGIVSEYRKYQIGYLFQDAMLIESLNVLENIKFYFNICGKKYNEEQLIKILDKVNLNRNILKKKIKQISIGEKQRLAIVCLLIKDPYIIICDEPTSALDEENKENIISLLKKIAEEESKIIIVASHDEDVINSADTLYHIEDNIIKKIRVKEELGSLINNETIGSHSKKFNFIRYSWKSFQNHYVLNLLVMLVICIGMSTILYYFTMDNHFYSLEKNAVKKHNNNSLVVSNESSIDLITNSWSSLGFTEEQVNTIKSLPGVNNVYPIHSFFSDGLVIGPERGTNRLSTIRSYDTNGKLGEKNYSPEEDINMYTIFSVYEYQNFDAKCSQLNKTVEGVYISQSMAETLRIENMNDAKISIEDCKIPVVVVVDYGMGKESTNSKSANFTVPVRGIIPDESIEFYRRNSMNVDTIYMSEKLMSQIRNENKVNIDEIKQQYLESFPEAMETDFIEYSPSYYVCEVNDTINEVRTRIEETDDKLSTFSLYSDSLNQLEAITGVVKTRTLQGIGIIVIVELIICAIVYMQSKQRLKEFCILKCNGFSNKDIKRMLLTEGSILSLITMMITLTYTYYRLNSNSLVSIFQMNIVNGKGFIITILLVLFSVIVPTLLSVYQLCKLSPLAFLRKKY